MRRSLALFCAVIAIAHPTPSFALEAQDLQVSREGDLDMNCAGLAAEALTMRDIIFTTEDIKTETGMQSTGIGVAGTAASFLIGTATGGVGIAAAGYLMNHMTDEKIANADKVQDIAEQRRSFMIGIYNAKGCFGPVENMLENPESAKPLLQKVSDLEPAAGTSEIQEYGQAATLSKRFNP